MPGQQVCDGCGASASSFQCPLCQAEIITDHGFFCSQKCFAKNWMEHRQTFHKRGVVRSKPQPKPEEAVIRRKRPAEIVKTEEEVTMKKKKIKKEEVEEQVAKEPPNDSVAKVWKVIPRLRNGVAWVNPPLSPGIPRVVIGGCSSDRRIAFWSAAAAAAHHIAAELSQQEKNVPFQVLVIATDSLAAHAMAWAARCSGLASMMQLVLAVDDSIASPSSYFSAQRRVVITNQDIVRRIADGSASSWLLQENSLLITLPGVTEAADFQAVHTRAIFFVYGRMGKECQMEEKWCAEENITHHTMTLKNAPAELHSIFSAGTTSSSPSDEGNRPTKDAGLIHLDNDVSTSLARGDLLGALQHLVRLYSTQRGVFENVLSNSFLCALGSASTPHAHHMLAYAMRYLVDHSTRFTAPQGGRLKDMTLRALVKVVRLLPPIEASKKKSHTTVESNEKPKSMTSGQSHSSSSNIKNTSGKNIPLSSSAVERSRLFNYYEALPTLQLQATLCYLYNHASPAVMDALGVAWSVKKVLQGPGALKHANKKRVDAVRRLQSRYGSKLGPSFANYLVILMHFLYDAVASYSLSVEEVEQRTLWSITLAEEVGPLSEFLSNCFLLHLEKKVRGVGNQAQVTSLSGRQVAQKPMSRKEQLRMLPVRTSVIEDPIAFSWVDLPLTGRRQRSVERLRQQAEEEILMAMPRNPRPMYVGDVGNLIGKWFRFNSRFDGALGVSLMEFLMQRREAFRVVGNLVTRKKAGVADQVRMRFDDDSGDDDDDEDDKEGRSSKVSRKAKDRAILTGAKTGDSKKGPGRDIPARARKKALAKAFNKARFNRNYKAIDPSAKVPGYVKHGPRRVKGRGRKANKRNVKRG